MGIIDIYTVGYSDSNSADALYHLLSLNYQLGIILQKRLDDFAIDTFLAVR